VQMGLSLEPTEHERADDGLASSASWRAHRPSTAALTSSTSAYLI
jgi:hypothetical protein